MLDFNDYASDWSVPSVLDFIRVDGLYFCDEGVVVKVTEFNVWVHSEFDGVIYAYALEDADTEITVLQTAAQRADGSRG